MKTYTGQIEQLEEHQVFVFGSNMQGFHGAGSAGYASFGVSGNMWRIFGYGRNPKGWRGLWNVKGVPEGYQEGSVGRSYAIPTVESAGGIAKGEADIISSVETMYEFAISRPEYEFLIAYSTNLNLNGYSPEKMASFFSRKSIPDNIVFEIEFSKLIDKEQE